jgi:hypothetical protein
MLRFCNVRSYIPVLLQYAKLPTDDHSIAEDCPGSQMNNLIQETDYAYSSHNLLSSGTEEGLTDADLISDSSFKSVW